MKILLILLALNFIADQLFQPKILLREKHKDTLLLFAHVCMWSITMLIFASVVIFKSGNVNGPMLWWLCSTIVHFGIEWVCLRTWTHFFYDNKRYKMVFWIVMEQFIINIWIVWLFVYFMEK